MCFPADSLGRDGRVVEQWPGDRHRRHAVRPRGRHLPPGLRRPVLDRDDLVVAEHPGAADRGVAPRRLSHQQRTPSPGGCSSGTRPAPTRAGWRTTRTQAGRSHAGGRRPPGHAASPGRFQREDADPADGLPRRLRRRQTPTSPSSSSIAASIRRDGSRPGEAPAMHNPHLDQLGHLTGELVLRRRADPDRLLLGPRPDLGTAGGAPLAEPEARVRPGRIPGRRPGGPRGGRSSGSGAAAGSSTSSATPTTRPASSASSDPRTATPPAGHR